MYRKSKDKRIRTSQAMIFGAWKSLVLNKPHESIKINELCEAAKVGRVTFYRLYDHLDDVVRQQLDDDIHKARQHLILYRLKHPMKKGMFKPLLMYFYRHPSVIQSVLNAKLSHLVYEQFLRNFLQNNPTVNTEENQFLLSLRLSIAINILEKWVTSNMKSSPDHLLSMIKTRMMQAIEELE
jgi:AcrR family transcriptional regulator